MRTGRPLSYPKEQIDKAVEVYESGAVSIKDACSLFGVAETTMARHLKSLGIETTDTTTGRFRAKRNEYMREYYRKNKDTIKKRVASYKIRTQAQYHDWRDINKIRVIQYYSGGSMCCSLCNESDMDILTIDHVDGGGNKHRRTINKGRYTAGGGFYRYLMANDFPDGFQVLCWNCNAKKGFIARRTRIPLWHQWSDAT